MSPPLEALRGLFGPKVHNSGVVYIMYDKSGNGKTTAGRALLSEFFRLASSRKNIKGFMLWGDSMGDNQSMMDEPDASSVGGWIHILIHALGEPDEDAPSILILDGINSLGPEEINKKFIKALYDSMEAQKNIFVVVICQDPDVATELCGLNKGQRVVPLPGLYQGDNLISPSWKETTWSRELLIEMIRAKYGEKVENFNFDYVRDGDTALKVVIETRALLRTTNEAPESPKKRQRTGQWLSQKHLLSSTYSNTVA